MAKRVAAAAESAGAEVRVRHVAETHDPASFAKNPAWTANYEATKDLPAATGDDIVWADAVIFGTPTRFGSPAAQLRTFIDSLGGLWADGKLADKVYAGYTSSNTAHGGQETTLLSLYITLIHWGGIIVPPGYTDPCKFVDGNPYGASLVATHDNIDEIDDATNAALDHLRARRAVPTEEVRVADTAEADSGLERGLDIREALQELPSRELRELCALLTCKPGCGQDVARDGVGAVDKRTVDHADVIGDPHQVAAAGPLAGAAAQDSVLQAAGADDGARRAGIGGQEGGIGSGSQGLFRRPSGARPHQQDRQSPR